MPSSAPSGSRRSFDPPSLDDLDYLPDPLGRIGRGDGAVPDDLFGGHVPDPQDAFDLQAAVGAGRANRRPDVFRLQTLLLREGYLDAAATEGPTGDWGVRDDYALRRFQKDNGLSIDGWAGPGGETIDTLCGFYRPRPAFQAGSRPGP